MYHPTTRVLTVLELLQSHAQLSGSELAQRLQIDARTLRRYVVTLEEMGIPITTEQGRYGGYRLVPGFKLPPLMFSVEEAQALALGLLAVRGMGLVDVAPAIESAQAKLDRVLPAGLKQESRALRQSIALATRHTVAGVDSKLLRDLSSAAEARRRTRLRYRAADGSESERGFDVYGLVFRAGRWYVVGHCQLRGGLRSLRLDRVVDATLTSADFVRPAGFDAAAYLSQALATLPRARTVEVLLHTSLAVARAELFEMLGTLEPREGAVLLRGTTDDLDWFARQLLHLSCRIEVLSPAELVPALSRSVARLAAQFPAPVSRRRGAARAAEPEL